MRNIKIAYILSFLWRSWFWLGCWIFYYLKFTDYAGIGFLETAMIVTSTLGEIPTGVVADLFGKKTSVAVAFFLGGAGNLIMACAPNYLILVLSIIIMTVGGAFYSGSLEALVYDSLKEVKQSTMYQKVLGRMTTMQNLGMAVAGITGGYLYVVHASLPFLAVAVAYLVGFIFSFYLIEPLLNTEKYSWSKFVSQNTQGFRQLFANKELAYVVILLIIPAAFMVATENVLNDATAVELGFNSVQLGVFSTILYLFGILVSERTDWFIRRVKSGWLYIVSVSLYFITLAIMPKALFFFGAFMLLARYGIQTFFGNYESIKINEIADSRFRATTLSTFSLLKNIPYALAATGVGALMNIYTAKTFSLFFGFFFVAVLFLFYLARPLFTREKLRI